MKKNKPRSFNYSAIYVCLIGGALLSQFFFSQPMQASLVEMQDYPAKKKLINIYNSFRFLLGDKVFNDATIGKDGWAFYTGGVSFNDYQKTAPVNVSNMKKIAGVLTQIKEKAAEFGGVLVVIIPPDKSTVYPQYMPDEITVIGDVSSLERITEYLNKNSDIYIADLTSTLIEASKTKQVYYKTDSHWNCDGAYYAYREIFSQLSAALPELVARPYDDFRVERAQGLTLDISRLLDLNIPEDSFSVTPRFRVDRMVTTVDERYPYRSLEIIENSNLPASPNLVVFRDSFFTNCLDEFVEPSFSRTVSLHYQDANLKGYLDVIESEKPKVVIVEFVERQIEKFSRDSSRE